MTGLEQVWYKKILLICWIDYFRHEYKENKVCMYYNSQKTILGKIMYISVKLKA